MHDTVLKHITHRNHSLKKGKDLELVIKAKLTKKEYKILKTWSEGTSIDVLKSKLNLDDSRYETLSQQLIKKLNQERVKQALAE